MSTPIAIFVFEKVNFEKKIDNFLPDQNFFLDNTSFPLGFEGIGNFSGILVQSGISGIFREGIFCFQEGIPFVAIPTLHGTEKCQKKE